MRRVGRTVVPWVVTAAVAVSALAAAGAPAQAATPSATVAPRAVVPVAPKTTISSTPLAFSRTDGDILAITRVVGLAVPAIAIGGNFRHVITPDGRWHPLRNFAILNERTGALLYAGNANSYVRSITSYKGVTYIGGDFTRFHNVARRHAAAITASFRLLAWSPSPRQTVRAMAADATGVYLTGDFAGLWKIPLIKGRTLWTRTTVGGSGRALLLLRGALFLGGLFEKYAGVTRHGLVRINPRTGAAFTTFNGHLRPDTGVGVDGAYDGEDVLSLAARGRTQLVVGVGGHAPAGKSSNQIYLKSAISGGSLWRQVLVGDCQAVAVVGATDVAGYHRNTPNTTTPYPYFAAQFNAPGLVLTTWDPKLTGNQLNADGGNNGVQAMYADPALKTLFVAGAFTDWNGTPTHQSLVALRWS